MKKRKIAIWLNVTTLCLCLATLAFGVYSAKTAKLNTSGTVSFQAHDCQVKVEGTILNAMRSESLNYAQVNTATYTAEQTGTVAWADSFTTGESYLISTDAWTFGDIYFDDMNIENTGSIQPITITLSISNYSNFPVKASFTVPTITDVETTGSVNEVFMDAKKTTDTDPTTGELKLTLTLGADVTEVAKQGLDLDVNVDKITTEEYNTNAPKIYTLEEGETELPDISTGDYTVLRLPSTLTTINSAYIPSTVTTIEVADGNTTYALTGDLLYRISDGSTVWISPKESIEIPKYVTNVAESGIPSTVKTITVASGNKAYASNGDVLYKKISGSSTVWVSPKESIEIPAGVKSISSDIIPSTVTTITVAEGNTTYKNDANGNVVLVSDETNIVWTKPTA